MKFQLSTKDIKIALDKVAKTDPDIREALKVVGYPVERRGGAPCYEHLLRIIVGQQISTKAAASVYARLEAGIDGAIPQNFLSKSDEELRAFGLSRQKVDYGRRLSQAVLDGFEPEALANKSDEEVLEAITALKGFGRWSAEMFLMFSLGRPDVWPADDLAIQEGVKRLKNLQKRPKPKEMDAIAEQWRPHRGAVAVLLWHYYSNAPL